MEIVFKDGFSENIRCGKVVGSKTYDGQRRNGVDSENILSIDNHALRIQPPFRPGWGRTALTYGPFQRKHGLAFSVLLLNGHNTSHASNVNQGLKNRIVSWAMGHDRSKKVIPWRAVQWLFSSNKRSFFHKLFWWYYIDAGKQLPVVEENLSVGWYDRSCLENIDRPGNYFVMHAALGDNGELWQRFNTGFIKSFKGVHNLPIFYITILRENGAEYYVSSFPGANELGSYPFFRLVAIDVFDSTKELYCGVNQSVLGQIGFRADTRVYQTELLRLYDYNKWYGYAQMADSFPVGEPLDKSRAEEGGVWDVVQGQFKKRSNQLFALEDNSLGIIKTEDASGLISIIVGIKTLPNLTIIFRYKDINHYWGICLSIHDISLFYKESGKKNKIAKKKLNLTDEVANFQVSDDGTDFTIFLDGNILFTQHSDLFNKETGIGFFFQYAGDENYIKSVEAHKRGINLSHFFHTDIFDMANGSETVIHDDFGSIDECLLDNWKTTSGGKSWRKEYGDGIFRLSGNKSCNVVASKDKPNPGSTAYTVSWEYPDFSDIRVNITIPGTKRGEGEMTRAGIILCQDRRNFITISMWIVDAYEGASVALFSNLNGFEDLYDAVWTMVGERIFWGKMVCLRVKCDGINICVYIDDTPVLYRSITDIVPRYKKLKINRVGLVANWEWGDDTGSVFSDFCVLNDKESNIDKKDITKDQKKTS